MVAIGLPKPYAKMELSESCTCIWCLLTLGCRCWFLLYRFPVTGSKYLEYISRIRILNNERTITIIKQIIKQYCIGNKHLNWMFWLNKRKETKSSQNTRIYHECTINNKCEPSSRGFYSKPRGTFRIESSQIRWFSGQSDGRLDLVRSGQRHSKIKPSRGAIRLYLVRGGQRCSS